MSTVIIPETTSRRSFVAVATVAAIMSGLIVAAVFLLTGTSDPGTPSTATGIGASTSFVKTAPVVKYRDNTSPDYLAFGYAVAAAGDFPAYLVPGSLSSTNEVAQMVCDKLRQGYSEAELANSITGAAYQLTASGARSVISAAHNYVCSGR